MEQSMRPAHGNRPHAARCLAALALALLLVAGCRAATQQGAGGLTPASPGPTVPRNGDAPPGEVTPGATPEPTPTAPGEDPLPWGAWPDLRFRQEPVFIGRGLEGPNGLYRDAQGYLYDSDWFGNVVNKLSPQGRVVARWEVPTPAGVHMDAHGALFVADYDHGRIFRIAPQGQVTVWKEGFRRPVWLAFDGEGLLWLTEYGARRVVALDPQGTVVHAFPFNEGPTGVTVVDDGTLLVTTWEGSLVRLSVPSGRQETVATGLPLGPVIALPGPDGHTYVVTYGKEDEPTGTVTRVRRDGTVEPPLLTGLDRPSAAVFDEQGNLYIAAVGDDGIRVYLAQPPG